MRFAHLSAAAVSDPGRKRGNNEDAFVSLPEAGVFAVADGMGGAADGEIASRAVATAISEAFDGGHHNDLSGLNRARLLIREAAVNSNAWIRDHAAERGARGAGSTLVALAFDENDPRRATVLHAGDSRAYRLRSGALSRLTTDHSVAEEAGIENDRELGLMFRSMVTRAVGISTTVELDEKTVDVEPGDIFMLCSDGLTGMAPDPDIRRIFVDNPGGEPELLAQMFVDAANARGGNDNITVLVIRVGTADVPPPDEESHATPPTHDDLGGDIERDETQSDEPDTTPHQLAAPDAVAPSSHTPTPTSDLECVTPRGEPASDEPTRTAFPVPPSRPPSASRVATKRETTPTEKRTFRPPLLAALAAAAVLAAAGLLLKWTNAPTVRRERPSPRHGPEEAAALPNTPPRKEPAAESKPPPPEEPRPSRAQPQPEEPRPSRAEPQPAHALSETEIMNMRLTLSTRIDGTLSTGEWGYMAEHIRKWAPSVPNYLAGSQREVLLSRWLSVWEKVRDGKTDPVAALQDSRNEVVALCRKAGFPPPPEERDSSSGTDSPSAHADVFCRLLHAQQKHATDNCAAFASRARDEIEVLGADPDKTLSNLWFFVADGDEKALSSARSCVGTIEEETKRLDLWLKTCADMPIPPDSIRLAPSVIVMKTIRAIEEQRRILAERMALIPSQASFWRQMDIENLRPELAKIEKLYADLLGESDRFESFFWQNPAKRKMLRALLSGISTASEIARKK